MTTIIIHITVLSRDPTKWRESHCDKSGGNTNKRRLLDHKSYNLNIRQKKWVKHSETWEHELIWISVIKGSHNTSAALEKYVLAGRHILTIIFLIFRKHFSVVYKQKKKIKQTNPSILNVLCGRFIRASLYIISSDAQVKKTVKPA